MNTITNLPTEIVIKEDNLYDLLDIHLDSNINDIVVSYLNLKENDTLNFCIVCMKYLHGDFFITINSLCF